MKRPFLLFVLFCIFYVSSAQSPFFERNFHSSLDNDLSGLHPMPDGSLLLPLLDDYHSGLSSIQMFRIDSIGNTTLAPVFLYGQLTDFDILPVADGYIGTAYFFQCDIFLRWIYKVSLDGTLLWQTDEFGPVASSPLGFKLLPGIAGNFWLFRPDAPPLLYDANGELGGISNNTFSIFKNFIQLPDNKTITYGYNGLALNNMVTPSKLGLQGYDVLKADTLSGHRVVALTKDSLFVLNEDFEVLKRLKHAIPVSEIADMDCDGDRIWILTSGPSAAILKYNTDLELIDNQSLVTNEPFQAQFLHLAGNRLVLAGRENTPPNVANNQVVLARAMPANSPNITPTTDASVIGVFSPQNPVATIIPPQSGPPTPPTSLIKFDNVFVSIKNEGDGILHQVTLNAVFPHYPDFCGPLLQEYQKTFYNLNIAPGDSSTLSLGSIFWLRDSMPLLPTNVSLCFWTILPNDSLDRDISNNRFCQTFGVTSLISDPAPMLQNIEIFPNPASGDCVIQLPGEPNGTAVLRLFDGMGRIVETELFSVSNVTLHRKDLPAGMYNVLITTENGRNYSGKVIFN